MFTLLTAFVLAYLVRLAQRGHYDDVERSFREHPSDDELVRHAIKATRPDVQPISHLLMGILLMLAVIADSLYFATKLNSIL